MGKGEQKRRRVLGREERMRIDGKEEKNDGKEDWEGKRKIREEEYNIRYNII